MDQKLGHCNNIADLILQVEFNNITSFLEEYILSLEFYNKVFHCSSFSTEEKQHFYLQKINT